MSSPLLYTICPVAPAAHLYEVSCTIAAPDPAGQRLALPTWIPGSYLIREFARHVVDIRAESAGRPVPLEKIDKCTWQAAPVRDSLRITCRIYAWDLSVRAAHLDGSHGFFNGTSVFLLPLGHEDAPCQVRIDPPPGEAGWQVATSLQPRAGDGARPGGFGWYGAPDYASLVDQPVEMGTFERLTFSVRGVPHQVALTGAGDFDRARLLADLERICAWQMDLFGAPGLEEPYVFLVMAVGSGYGGLEHRNSTALLCDRTDLPTPGLAADAWPEGYVRFLGLCSHEYFHRWHVKRIRPAAFMAPDLGREAYTRLLWLFEGFTSYYDDLCLVRAGVIPAATYLELLGKTLSQVQRGPGRRVQSLAESSFDAWIKYYRPDENTPNAVVSYYAKGALVALCLDLALRRRGSSLDQLMRRLWQDYGARERGLEEAEIFALVAELGGQALGRWLREAVAGTGDLPLERHLAWAGVRLEWQAEGRAPWLGLKLAADNGEAKLAQVLSGGPAEQAGLAAGDLLVALNGQRVTRANLDTLLTSLGCSQALEVHYFRHDLLRQGHISPAEAPRDKAVLSPMGGAAGRRRQTWLEDAGREGRA